MSQAASASSDGGAKAPDGRIGRGAVADGAAPLDAAGKLPATHLPDAAGAVRLATDAEAENASGTGALQARQIALRAATTGRAGAAELATTAEGLSGQDQTRAMTPAATKAAIAAAIAAAPGGVTSVLVANAAGPSQGYGSDLVKTTYALARSVSGGTVTVTLVRTDYYREADDDNDDDD